MKIKLISVGERMPEWVGAGVHEYATRLPNQLFELVEIPLGKRGKNADIERARAREGEAMLKAVPANARVVTLEVHGKAWSTEVLAEQLEGWMQDGRDVALLVGGPDGLAPVCLARAELRWSLSKLTFPHMLVRLLLAEQIYRAWTITQHHPYHRP